MTEPGNSVWRRMSLLRSELDGFAARQAALAVAAEPGLARRIETALPAVAAAVDRGNYPAFRAADRHLHETIIEVAGVPGLIDCWLVVWHGQAELHRTSFAQCWPDLRLLVSEHTALVEAICLGDPAAAEDAARAHNAAVWYRYDDLQQAGDEQDPVQRAVAYLAFRLGGPVRLADVAAAAYTSPGNLTRLFRQRFGVGFQAYLQARRMEQAADLLRGTRLPVARVAARVGYRDASRFGQHFKRHHGQSPSQWRHASR